MAWTTTKANQYNVGDKVVQLWKLTADSATLELSTGLNVLAHAQASPGSLTTTIGACYINATSAAVASNGLVSVTGVTSGDEIFLTVWGN